MSSQSQSPNTYEFKFEGDTIKELKINGGTLGPIKLGELQEGLQKNNFTTIVGEIAKAITDKGYNTGEPILTGGAKKSRRQRNKKNKTRRIPRRNKTN